MELQRLKSMENDIMTLEEVAAYLRLKPQTIYTWAQEKKIPAAKLGKEWRFKRSIIDEWFLQHIDDKFADIIQKVKTVKIQHYDTSITKKEAI